MADSRGRVWTGVIRVAPSRGDHRVALRAAVSVGVPLLMLWAIGRLDLSIYASFGAFAALYGRTDGFGDRLRMQAGAGGILVLAMLAGTGLSVVGAPPLVSVVSVAVVASLVTLLAYAMRWHPPGGLFAVFAIGATASIPASTASFANVLAVGVGSVIFSLLVTTVLAAAGARRLPGIEITRVRQPIGDVAWEMAVTVGVATLLGGAIGLLLVGTHWYWAMVGAAAAVSGAHLTARVIRGLQRLVGTLAGILVAAGILALHLPPLAVILIAIAFQACAEMFVGRNYGIAMIFITPLALMMVELAAPSPVDVLLRDRMLETVIGVAAGTLIAVISAAVRRNNTTSRG
ncbi:FUSC family protein [Microbacterium bovistercoris]|uniref:FUSC family protein n=1 Tax=Microbacterium bovistercoris TaxID=2293570 RepID=A0A371NTW2_9MICO|nr:FUSC family protein [Microbacterium bovistercoris]REJ05147.1 FUSC family protein [Microbacterium bovistercoris]